MRPSSHFTGARINNWLANTVNHTGIPGLELVIDNMEASSCCRAALWKDTEYYVGYGKSPAEAIKQLKKKLPRSATTRK